MITRHALMLATVVTLTAIVAGPASSQTSPAALQIRTPPRGEVSGAAAATIRGHANRLRVVPSNCRVADARPCSSTAGLRAAVCRRSNPAFKANLPNVRVSFVLQAIANDIVANGGVNGDPFTFVEWLTTSSAASVEHGGPYGYILPPPGVTWDGDDLYHMVIYDALVFNACESFSSFPVEHDAVDRGQRQRDWRIQRQ